MYNDLKKGFSVKENPTILAIESSCDETAAAVIDGERNILSNEIMSSCTEHIKFGGVVPEIASRAHVTAVSLVVEEAIKKSGKTLQEIDAVAVTYGAGLLGALLVGVSYAKSLAYALGVPLIPVSHIRGHLSAAYLTDRNLKPPFISLLLSGGHTAVILVKDYNEYQVLGGTLDDAVGEAFDKVARVIGLNYPGGPNVERLALSGKDTVQLPKMLKGEGGYNFSYSGLKTAVINYVHNAEQKGEKVNFADVACSFQKTALDAPITASLKALDEYNINTLTVGGGVAANGYLREKLTFECEKRNIKLVLPPKPLCTDNAAMIASEGLIQYRLKNFASLDLNAKARVDIQN